MAKIRHPSAHLILQFLCRLLLHYWYNFPQHPKKSSETLKTRRIILIPFEPAHVTFYASRTRQKPFGRNLQPEARKVAPNAKTKPYCSLDSQNHKYPKSETLSLSPQPSAPNPNTTPHHSGRRPWAQSPPPSAASVSVRTRPGPAWGLGFRVLGLAFKCRAY